MPDEKAPEVSMAGGLVTSSAIPGFHRIPTEAMRRLAARFDYGVERKGEDKAWNACSNNQVVLTNKAFILERIGHVINHALKLRDKIVSGKSGMDGDDDAGAVIWGGAFLCSATKALSEAISCSACGGTGKFLDTGNPCPACKGSGKSKL